MPEFADIHSVYTPPKKLTDVEILRAIKFGIASEFEAIQLYQQIMESTDNPDVHKVLTDITDDEKHHAGVYINCYRFYHPKMNNNTYTVCKKPSKI